MQLMRFVFSHKIVPSSWLIKLTARIKSKSNIFCYTLWQAVSLNRFNINAEIINRRSTHPVLTTMCFPECSLFRRNKTLHYLKGIVCCLEDNLNYRNENEKNATCHGDWNGIHR